MENFGPYIDEAIDFTELNEQRLFLLEGKTGCGKSTIIEGVVFALYGNDSKGRSEGVRRNSAPAKENATVTLDFEVEGVTYRVVRSPLMTDPETGKNLKSQKVNLAEIDSVGNVIAGRTWDAVKEVKGKIRSIIRSSHSIHSNCCPSTRPILQVLEIQIRRETSTEAIFPSKIGKR